MDATTRRSSSLRELGRILGASDGARRSPQPPPVVLVVDDDAHLRTALQALLEEQYRVRPCSSGDQAIRSVDSTVSAVILDIKMPGRDGFSTFRAIKKRFPHLPIIFYSAYQDLKDPYVIMNQYQPFAYITKGSNPERLLTAVARAVRHHGRIMHHDAVSRRLLVRVLNEVRHATGARRGVFVRARGRRLRLLAEVSAPHPGPTEPDPLTSPLLASALATGRPHVAGVDAARWPDSAVASAAQGEASVLCLPVGRGSAPYGAVWLEKAGATFTPADLQHAQHAADEIGLAAEVSGLYVRHLRSRLQERALRQTKLRARLQALQARINPHFLYNSLSTIAGLTAEDPACAERMLVQLSRVFRHVLERSRRRHVPLGDELAVVRDYLGIESLRLGSRLRIAESIPAAAGDVPVPPLLLLGLVENAVLHGIAPRREGGIVQVSARLLPGTLELVVEDDGPGLGRSPHQGSGMTWRDANRRLSLLYGRAAALRRGPGPRGGHQVVLTLPRKLGDVPCEPS